MSDGTAIDRLGERNTLSKALLETTAALAWREEPSLILRKVCDALVAASPHIRLAWMVLGNLDADEFQPEYAAGPATDYGYSLVFSHSQTKGPARLAIERWEPVIGDIGGEKVFDDVREKALAEQLRSTVCLPVGQKESDHAGIVAVYADTNHYFEEIGLDLFIAFAQIVSVSLEQTALISQLNYLAHFDPLTEILNRRGMQDHLEQAIARHRRRNEPFSVALFDIDRFKLINDGLGHENGDKVLQHVARTIDAALRDEDRLGRWGGEEFLCLLTGAPREAAGNIAERFRAMIANAPLSIANRLVTVTASFGYATYPEDGKDLDKLIAAADSALYQAKDSGRNRVVGAQRDNLNIQQVGLLLDEAVRNVRIVAANQPIVDLNSGKAVAVGSVARILNNRGGLMEAKEFIGAARQLQMLHQIDFAVFSQVLKSCRGSRGKERLPQFLNISADLLRHEELVSELLQVAREKCLNCGNDCDRPSIVLQISERELLRDIETVRRLLQPFLELKFQLALNDFGGGYSSFNYLMELPIQYIKIDANLVHRVSESKVQAILRGIQDTATQLAITTIAEQVEDEATAGALIDLGINWAQGFYYGEPSTGRVGE